MTPSTEQPLSIGWVVPGALDGREGSVRFDARVIEALRARGHQVSVVSLPPVPWMSALRDAAQQDARRRMAAVPCDVWIEDENAHPWLHGASGWRLRVPRVALIHHLRVDEGLPLPLGPAAAAVERRYLRGVDAHWSVSETTHERVVAVAGTARASCITAPVGSLDGHRPPWSQRAARLAQGAPLRMLFVGTWSERKGIVPLLDALTRLHKRAPTMPWTLRIIGGPGDDAKVAGTVGQRLYALPRHRVELLGRLGPAGMASSYAASDLVVIPSTTEGFGMAYLEGQRFGLPAVSGRVGAARELVVPGDTGWRVHAGRPKAIEATLWTILQDRALLAARSEGAYRAFARWPTWSETVPVIEMFVRGVVQRRWSPATLLRVTSPHYSSASQ